MSFDAAELVHLGYALMLCALVARDVLWLRGMLVAAQSTLTVYAWLTDRPGMAAWNALFVAINAGWALRIARERRAVELPPELRAIHERRFAAFTPPEFLRFWSSAHDRDFPGGRIVTAGEAPPELMLLLNGEARVMQGIRTVATLRPGSFIAEMSLVADTVASADVEALGGVRVRAWPMAEVRKLRARQPLLWSKLQSSIGYDLVEKLKVAPTTSSGDRAKPGR
ncbi:MAG: Crp/Fnr family transcriptional regulator [Candidatus Binatia bacterium]